MKYRLAVIGCGNMGSAIVAELASGKPVTEVLAFVKSLADGAHRA